MREVELAIVGAGPAGMAAAIEAAKSGVKITLIDENPKPGGQIYQQLPGSFSIRDINQMGKDYVQGQKLLEKIDKYGSNIDFLEGAVVWGAFEDRTLEIVYQEKNQTLKPQKLILAEGALERPMPFPGWTLPGVYAAGGVQRMVKTQRVLPGKRFILTGTGPLQLVVANQLIRAGAEVAGVLEAGSAEGWWKHLSKIWGQWELVKDGLRYLNELRKAKVPFLSPYGIVEAHGNDHVTGATYAKLDKDWKPIAGTEKVLELDTICVGYGFIPSIRLSELLGCKHRYHHNLGGWISEHDIYMETSVPGVFVAGDGAGVAGSMVAIEEGRLCSMRACNQLGRIKESELERLSSPIFKKLKEMRKFRTALDELSAIRPGWFTRIRDDTIICRCEEVTASEIRKRIAEGATNVNEIKFFSRAGMGHCQGRMCESSLQALLTLETNRPIEEVGRLTSRPPIRPIPSGQLLE